MKVSGARSRRARGPVADRVDPLRRARGDLARQRGHRGSPGAGKTTVVPLALLEHGDLGSGEILVLQPRRLAARLSAVRTASLLRERVGERVGYRVRFEQSGGERTRLWFMTEGVLLRRLLEDPELRGVDAVILDEFHERHLEGDLALALLRRLDMRRANAESRLRLLAMSATLDAEPVARFLSATRLRTEGKMFPVEIEYRKPGARHEELPLERRVAAAVRELIERGLIGSSAEQAGHALVFLPGAREIQAAREACAALAESAGLELATLHGQLSRELQDRALAQTDRSKLILSTNVAETSITIDGVVAVIDSGLARVADFDPSSSLPRLSLVPISRAAATQRAGRAGRTRAGVCIRLYSRHDHDTRPEQQLPEVRRLELAGPVLELAAAGVHAPESFEWFEATEPRRARGGAGIVDLARGDRARRSADGARPHDVARASASATRSAAGRGGRCGRRRDGRERGGAVGRATVAALGWAAAAHDGRRHPRRDRAARRPRGSSIDRPGALAAVEQAAKQLREQARKLAANRTRSPSDRVQRERALRRHCSRRTPIASRWSASTSTIAARWCSRLAAARSCRATAACDRQIT